MSRSGEGSGVRRGVERGHQQKLRILNRRVAERESSGEYYRRGKKHVVVQLWSR